MKSSSCDHRYPPHFRLNVYTDVGLFVVCIGRSIAEKKSPCYYVYYFISYFFKD